jgi:hypothetical protein
MSDEFNPALRERVLADVVGFSVKEDLAQFRHSQLLRAAVFPHLPSELWPYVPVQVLVATVDEETGEVFERFESVEANELTMAEHGDDMLPDLLNVEVVEMPSADLSRFSGYCLQFYEYMTALRDQYHETVVTMEQQRKELLNLLPTAVYDHVSNAAAVRAAKADPFVRQLERSILADKKVIQTLDRRARAIKVRMDQNSREQSRRTDLGRMYQAPTGHAGAPSSVPTATPRRRVPSFPTRKSR